MRLQKTHLGLNCLLEVKTTYLIKNTIKKEMLNHYLFILANIKTCQKVVNGLFGGWH